MEEGLSCFCALDLDGECKECKSEMVTAFKGALPSLRKLVADLAKGGEDPRMIIERSRASNDFKIVAPCNECNLRYADLIMSGFIPLLGDGPPLLAESFTQGILEVCEKHGVKAMPLTIKAWRDLRGAKGWL